MKRHTAEQLCVELGVTAEDVRVAAAVQLTLGELDVKSVETLDSALGYAERLLGQRQFVNAVRWATWVRFAKDHQQLGKDFNDLLKLRKETSDGDEKAG